MKKYAFGVDIGGTTCKIGLFYENGELLEKWEIKTDKGNQGKNVLYMVAASLRGKMCEREILDTQVLGIGIGAAGIKDKKGSFFCPNLNWEYIFVEKEMSLLMNGMKIKALNDANAAALGEMWKGSAGGFRDVVMVTLGTGVGGGIIIDGNIIEGVHGVAGEIGGIVVNPEEDEEFIAGPKGCLEQYTSATGLVNMTKRKLLLPHDASVLDEFETVTAKSVFDASKNGDKLATEIVKEFCTILGKGLARISYVVDPEIFIIGGGVSKAGNVLIEGVRNAFLEDAPEMCRDTKFVLASLGNDAGIYGAVYALLEDKGENA